MVDYLLANGLRARYLPSDPKFVQSPEGTILIVVQPKSLEPLEYAITESPRMQEIKKADAEKLDALKRD